MIKLQLFYEILFCLEGKGIIFKMATTLTEKIVWGYCVFKLEMGFSSRWSFSLWNWISHLLLCFC